jgi:hypothetical protein
MGTIVVWDAGTGWKLPVLQAILDEDPNKLNQVSPLPILEGGGLNERARFPSM